MLNPKTLYIKRQVTPRTFLFIFSIWYARIKKIKIETNLPWPILILSSDGLHLYNIVKSGELPPYPCLYFTNIYAESRNGVLHYQMQKHSKSRVRNAVCRHSPMQAGAESERQRHVGSMREHSSFHNMIDTMHHAL
jgi:hypothetical protein